MDIIGVKDRRNFRIRFQIPLLHEFSKVLVPLSNNRIHSRSDDGTPRVQILTNITTKFIVLLFFPPIDLQMNARQGCTGGGRELHTHVLSRLFRDRTLVERIRESTIFSPTIYRGNDPFEHVPASTSREMKNFFLLTRNKDANILAFA